MSLRQKSTLRHYSLYLRTVETLFIILEAIYLMIIFHRKMSLGFCFYNQVNRLTI